MKRKKPPNKSYQEQLAEAAKSLGFKATAEPASQIAEKKYEKIIKKLAPTSKNKMNVRELAEYIGKAMSDGKLSAIDSFFCLATLGIEMKQQCHHIYQFKYYLSISAAETRANVEFSDNNLSEKDVSAFKQLFKEVQDLVLEKPFEDKYAKLSKERKLKQDKDRRNRALSIVESFWKLAHQAVSRIESAHLAMPRFDDDDLNLVKMWSNEKHMWKDVTLLNLDETSSYSKDYHLGRLLSARAAEKAAMIFYQKYGFQVEDVSVKQFKERGSPDWKYYDLLVEAFSPVDVKNSRQGLNSKKRYVEHCVPNFKIDRNNHEVTICGILSPYLWPYHLVRPDEANTDTEILFLGQTSMKKLKDLIREFEEKNMLSLHLGEPGRYFIPPWMFDYPDYAYRKRDNALNKLQEKDVADSRLWGEARLNPIPVCVAAGIDLGKFWDDESLADWEWKLFYELSDFTKKYGLSLPFLYLTLLRHFLKMVRSAELVAEYFDPAKYAKFFFYNSERTAPMTIYDPLETINGLINSLAILWQAEHGLIRKFSIFKLKSFNILLGKSKPSEDWKTLIAYCGGVLPDHRKCGKNPLVLGQAKHCPMCWKLICPDCDFCSKDCERYQQSTSFKNGIETDSPHELPSST